MTSRVMREFDLLLPESVSEAITLLATHKDKAAVLAGGTDLLVALKFDYDIDNVISLALVPGLNNLSFDTKLGLTIGASTFSVKSAPHFSSNSSMTSGVHISFNMSSISLLSLRGGLDRLRAGAVSSAVSSPWLWPKVARNCARSTDLS